MQRAAATEPANPEQIADGFTSYTVTLKDLTTQRCEARLVVKSFKHAKAKQLALDKRLKQAQQEIKEINLRGLGANASLWRRRAQQSGMCGLNTPVPASPRRRGNGDLTAVQLFLDAGMDVNEGGGAAIGLAAGRGKTAMVKFLLSKGAEPTSSALQYAKTRGHPDIEKMLVDAGAKE